MKKISVVACCAMMMIFTSPATASPHKWIGSYYGNGQKESFANPRMLLIWNDAATHAVVIAGNNQGVPMAPMPESRIYAMVNVAMHDALNNIRPLNRTYALSNNIDTGANADAAVATAARDVIAALMPTAKTYADSLYYVSIDAISNGKARTKGIYLGKAAALAVLAKRKNDGNDKAMLPYKGGTLPGQYRATPPFDTAPFNGFVDVPGWGNIQPFGLAAASQYRPVAPYPINSSEYAKDLDEVKKLGAASNSTRTAAQTQIGLFWMENCPSGWNRIARNLILQKKLDAWAAARLLGILHIAIADANISSFEAKFFYNYWRPVTAVRLADSDGNPTTTGNTAWDVLAPPTPPVADYPSNHAVNGASAAAVLKDFFGDDAISFTATSTSLPNVQRHFNSFSQAAHENALSRIYIGYHFRNAVERGEEMGYKIGHYVYEHMLQQMEQ